MRPMGRGVGRLLDKGKTLTSLGSSFRGTREKWNFKCRKEYSWQLNNLPNDPKGLGH